MSDSKELRRIVGAMTERPWRNGADPSHFDAPEVTDSRTFAYHVTHDADARGISALANHADALVALVEAVERHRGRLEHTLAGAIGDRQAGEIRALLTALAAVHSIGATP